MSNNTTHIVCFSGGHSSALAAIEVHRKFGKEDNVILLNHDINPNYEDADIKRFKNAIAAYLGINITYANMNEVNDGSEIPSQFKVCIDSGTMTDYKGNAICTARLKTEPFYDFLKKNYPPLGNLFYKPVLIYYGFDAKEKDRMIRRTSILGAMGYKTDYPLVWNNRTIHSTNEIGIVKPLTYDVYEHANCKGCLKASLLHWYVVYVHHRFIYQEAIEMEEKLDFTIHTVTRNKIKTPISLIELAPIFEQFIKDGITATEHQSKKLFAQKIRKYQIEESDSIRKPCMCSF